MKYMDFSNEAMATIALAAASASVGVKLDSDNTPGRYNAKFSTSKIARQAIAKRKAKTKARRKAAKKSRK